MSRQERIYSDTIFLGHLLLLFAPMWMFQEKSQEVAYCLAFLCGMSEGHIKRDAVTIGSSISEAPDIALFLQIIKYALHRPLGNTDDGGNLSSRNMFILCYTEKDLGVIS
jgi:hypothetical protein